MAYIALLCIVLIAIGGGLGLRFGLRFRQRARRQDAMRQFVVQHEQLATDFLAAAQASGKPRGLAWKDVTLSGEPAFAIDRVSGELIGLITATISFEAIQGGGMEDVEAVGNLRTASAIFANHGGGWSTEGKAAFNLEPHEVLEKFSDTLAPFPPTDVAIGSK